LTKNQSPTLPPPDGTPAGQVDPAKAVLERQLALSKYYFRKANDPLSTTAVSEVAISMLPSGNLRTAVVGVEPEFIDAYCGALLDLVEKLQRHAEEARMRELRPAASILSLPVRR
jgi:hypothetical protein